MYNSRNLKKKTNTNITLCRLVITLSCPGVYYLRMVFDHLFDQTYNKNSLSSHCTYIQLIHSSAIKNKPNIYNDKNHLHLMPGKAKNDWSFCSCCVSSRQVQEQPYPFFYTLWKTIFLVMTFTNQSFSNNDYGCFTNLTNSNVNCLCAHHEYKNGGHSSNHS